MDLERIVLLNEHREPIGDAPKLASHHASTPLHLAFSCYLFDGRGRLLLTRRANGKKVWPGMWTNSVCGHPAPRETFKDAIQRRARFELGLENVEAIKVVNDDYQYRTPLSNGIRENEYCPVYIGRINDDPVVNSDEVGDWKWIIWKELKEAIAKDGEQYSYWLQQQIPLVEASPLLAEYTTAMERA